MKTIEQYKLELKDQLLSWIGKNDPAHQWEHFNSVYEAGTLINKTLGLGYPEEAILLVAYVHDLFAWDRDVHHVRSQAWVDMGVDHPRVVQELIEKSVSKWPAGKGNFPRAYLAQACGQHRASFRGEFTHEFCELINSADYEKPGKLLPMMVRAWKYAQGHLGVDEHSAVKHAIEHMVEKFGRDGYAIYPAMYKQVFAQQVEEIYVEIDHLPKDPTQEEIDQFLQLFKEAA